MDWVANWLLLGKFGLDDLGTITAGTVRELSDRTQLNELNGTKLHSNNMNWTEAEVNELFRHWRQ